MEAPQVQIAHSEVVNYLKTEIARRTAYKTKLEQTPAFKGFDGFSRDRREEDRENLRNSIDTIYNNAILPIIKEKFQSVQISDNPEVTIANVLALLPSEKAKDDIEEFDPSVV